MSTTASEARHDESKRSPAWTSSPPRFLTLRTRDEAKRFLRDLCTRGELEALAHRWQIVRLLEEGRPYLEIAERVHTSTATVTRVAQWLRHGAGGYGSRSTGRARSAHERRRRGTPARRRPLEGTDGTAGARAARRRRSPLRSRRAGAARALPERTGRPAARPAARHPGVRSGRRRARWDHRREPCRGGRGGRRPARRSGLRPLHAGGGRPGRCAAAGDRRARRVTGRDGLPGLDPCRARRAGRRGRARPRLRVGRGGAAPRPLRRRRRPRLHGLDRERQRSPPDRAGCSPRRRS